MATLTNSGSGAALPGAGWAHVTVTSDRRGWVCNHCSKPVSGLNHTRVIGHLVGNSQDIASCKQIPTGVKAELQAAVDLKKSDSGKKKLAKAVGAAMNGVIINSATDAVMGNRQRSSASFGATGGGGGGGEGGEKRGPSQPTITAAMKRQSGIEADSRASMAIADLIHSYGYAEDCAESAKWQNAMDLVKKTSKNWKPPGAHLVGGDLLDGLSEQHELHSFSRLEPHKKYGYALASDGATVNKTPLINLLIIVAHVFMLLAIVDCSGYVAEGGIKDGEFIATECAMYMEPEHPHYGARDFDLVIFDGASNMKAAGTQLMEAYPWITLIWCVLHLVNLVFKKIASHEDIENMIANYKIIRDWIENHTFQRAKFMELSKKHNNGVYLGLLLASDTRFGGWFMALWRLLRNRPALQELVLCSEYKAKKFKDDPIRDFILDDDAWLQIYSVLRVVWPLIPLMRLADSNGPVIGHIFFLTVQTKKLIDKAMATDNTAFMSGVAGHIKDSFDQYSGEMLSPFALTAFLLNPFYREDAKELLEIDHDGKFMDSFNEIAKRLLYDEGLAGEDDYDEKMDAVLVEVAEVLSDFHNATGRYRPAQFGSPLAEHEPHKWHTAHSRGPFRTLGERACSKPAGSGQAVRNWADVKHVWQKTKANMKLDKAEKKVKIYGANSRDPTLNGRGEQEITDVWKKRDEVWDTMDLPEQSGVGALKQAATGATFKAYLEEGEAEKVGAFSPVNKQFLLGKYSGMRLLDDDDVMRIRGDDLKWKGGKNKGWLVCCDEMPSDDPKDDPEGDLPFHEEDYPEPASYYPIDDVLLTMITLADQTEKVIVYAHDEDEDEDEDEETYAMEDEQDALDQETQNLIEAVNENDGNQVDEDAIGEDGTAAAAASAFTDPELFVDARVLVNFYGVAYPGSIVRKATGKGTGTDSFDFLQAEGFKAEDGLPTGHDAEVAAYRVKFDDEERQYTLSLPMEREATIGTPEWGQWSRA